MFLQALRQEENVRRIKCIVGRGYDHTVHGGGKEYDVRRDARKLGELGFCGETGKNVGSFAVLKLFILTLHHCSRLCRHDEARCIVTKKRQPIPFSCLYNWRRDLHIPCLGDCKWGPLMGRPNWEPKTIRQTRYLIQ